MGTLVCPLCCNEEFSSQLSLKYHLLSITDNMYCPECNTRFDSILQLANHLDGTCGKLVSDTNKRDEEILTREEKSLEETNLIDEEILEPIQQTHEIKTDSAIKEPNVVEHYHSAPDMPMEVDIELDANGTNSQPNESEHIVIQNQDVKQNEDSPKNYEYFRDIEQIDVIDKLKDMASDTVETQSADIAVAPAVTEQYACSSCAVTFSSIVEHIQMYHTGQEVMINVPGTNNEVLSKLVTLPEGANANVAENANVADGDSKSSTPTYMGGSNESVHHKEKPEFVKKREIIRPFCLFKENTHITSNKGKIKHLSKKIFKPVENSELRYISKEVKIGKFWEKQADEKQTNSPVSMEKILDSGIKKEVRKFPLKKNMRPSLEKLLGGNFLLKSSGNREMTSGPCLGMNRVPEVKLIISSGDQGIENTISVYTCSTCQKEFGNIYAFERHSCTVTKTSSLVCRICVVQFANLENMQSHMQDVHGIKFGKLSLPIKCEPCNVIFASARAFRQHEKMHKPMECPVCHIICSNNRILSQHMMIHTNTLQIKTDEENGEKSSIKTEGEDLPRILVCKECCKIFANNEDLKAHWQEHASKEDENITREILPEETNESPKDEEGERMQNENNTESFVQCHREIDKSCKEMSSKYHVWAPI